MKVYGPYIHSTGQLKGRRYVNIVRHDGSRTTMLYSRYIMEQHVGRELYYDETVDHIDEDFTNDDISNLAILTRAENAGKSSRLRQSIEWHEFICPYCKCIAKKNARHVRHNRKLGKKGPFCGRQCAGKWSMS